MPVKSTKEIKEGMDDWGLRVYERAENDFQLVRMDDTISALITKLKNSENKIRELENKMELFESKVADLTGWIEKLNKEISVVRARNKQFY